MEALRKRLWTRRLTWIAAILCFGAAAVALVGSIGSGRGAWHFRTGFVMVEYGVYAAVIGLVVAVAALVMAWRGRSRLAFVNLAALLVAAAFLSFILNQVRAARAAPAIHDIATNLEDWPRFYRLRIRDDNLAAIPDLGRSELAAMSPRERWKVIHREFYGDIAPIRVPWSVEETLERARALAEERDWEIVTHDEEAGVIEAIDTSFFFRLEDNIVIRVRPLSDGGGSIVDMRSVSRVGVHDAGANARRVREFLRELRRG